MIIAHNADETQTYKKAMNKFGDYTEEEFATMYRNLNISAKQANEVKILDTEALPTTVDWNKAGAVTPVKDQGQCGSCWAFSTTGALEGAEFVEKKTLLSFSEKQLVDCSGKYGNQGCNGGLMDNGFQYVQKRGITTEDKYPYQPVKGKCHYHHDANSVYVKSFTDVPKGDVN